MKTKSQVSLADDWISKPLLDKLIERTPQKDLFDVIFENPDLVIFTCNKEAEGVDNTVVCEDPQKEGTAYVMRTKKSAIIITNRFYTIITDAPACMAAIKLAESIHQTEIMKT